MKKHSKQFVISWAVYPFDVAVFLGSTKEQVWAFLKKRKVELTEELKKEVQMFGRGRTVMLPSGQTILWINYLPNQVTGVLAHEIYHAVYFLFDKIGIPANADEAWAYAMEYLTNEIRKKL